MPGTVLTSWYSAEAVLALSSALLLPVSGNSLYHNSIRWSLSVVFQPGTNESYTNCAAEVRMPDEEVLTYVLFTPETLARAWTI